MVAPRRNLVPNLNRRRSGGEAVKLGLTFFVVLGALFLLETWVVMVLWGAIAGAIGFTTIGFGTAALVVCAMSVIGGFFKKSS